MTGEGPITKYGTRTSFYPLAGPLESFGRWAWRLLMRLFVDLHALRLEDHFLAEIDAAAAASRSRAVSA